jgi:hypothetical protein
MKENLTLNVDYGRQRVTLTHSTPAAEAGRVLWDQSNGVRKLSNLKPVFITTVGGTSNDHRT